MLVDSGAMENVIHDMKTVQCYLRRNGRFTLDIQPLNVRCKLEAKLEVLNGSRLYDYDSKVKETNDRSD